MYKYQHVRMDLETGYMIPFPSGSDNPVGGH